VTGTIVFPSVDPAFDQVTAVLVPADRSSRRRVTSGVRATLWDDQNDRDLPDRLVRNLSGALVLLNRPLGETYTFRVDPTAAGYSGPFLVAFQPDAGNRSQIVWLSSRPDSPFDPGTTLIRGVVTRTAPSASAAGIEIAAVPRRGDGGAPHDNDPTFTGTTDERGSFAVAVHLEVPDDGDLDATVETALTLNRGGTPHRELVVHLHHGREHVFAEALDLDGGNEPPFTDGARP
jgi:hypothetical protein